MVTNLHAMAFAANANRNNKFEHAKTRALFVISPLKAKKTTAKKHDWAETKLQIDLSGDGKIGTVK
jgi:succinyl-CoA synthetase beta subunit